MPIRDIQLPSSRWQSRMAEDKKVRRVLPESSLQLANFLQRAITSSAFAAISARVSTGHPFRQMRASM
jgi:hypothetical protein